MSKLFRPFPKPLLMLDMETTGQRANLHGVIDLAAQLLDPVTLNVMQETSYPILPPEDTVWTEEAIRIHGVTEKQALMDKGRMSYPYAVGVFLRDFNTGPYIIAGWNVAFEVSFLWDMFFTAGVEKYWAEIDYHHYDVWTAVQTQICNGEYFGDAHSLTPLLQQHGLRRSDHHTGIECCRLQTKILRIALGLEE